jgi:zinc finger CCHC domain-containing protein 8
LTSDSTQHPFNLNIVDIYGEEGKPWQKKYAWWIPALHLNGTEIAKGRWNETTVREALEIWGKRQEMDDQK